MKQVNDLSTTTIHNSLQCPFSHDTARLHWPAVHISRYSSSGLLFRHPPPPQEDLVKLYQKSWSDPYEHTSETGERISAWHGPMQEG
jgi:hypothetical protein